MNPGVHAGFFLSNKTTIDCRSEQTIEMQLRELDSFAPDALFLSEDNEIGRCLLVQQNKVQWRKYGSHISNLQKTQSSSIRTEYDTEKKRRERLIQSQKL